MVDYLMGSPSPLPKTIDFIVSSRPIVVAFNHAYLSFKVKEECQKDDMLRMELSMLNTNYLGKHLVYR